MTKNEKIIACYKKQNNIPLDEPLYTFAAWKEKGYQLKSEQPSMHCVKLLRKYGGKFSYYKTYLFEQGQVYKPQWVQALPKDVYYRLAECSTTKEDVPVLIQVYKETHKEFTIDQIMADVFEMLEANGQQKLIELSQKEYELLKENYNGL